MVVFEFPDGDEEDIVQDTEWPAGNFGIAELVQSILKGRQRSLDQILDIFRSRGVWRGEEKPASPPDVSLN